MIDQLTYANIKPNNTKLVLLKATGFVRQRQRKRVYEHDVHLKTKTEMTPLAACTFHG